MIEGRCHCGNAGWLLAAEPTSGLVCNCTLCRRIGGIWAYGHAGEGIDLIAPPGGWARYVQGDRTLEVLRCPECGCAAAWRGLAPGEDGRIRVAVNLRLADPAAVRHLPLRRFDGAGSWTQAPDSGQILGDFWL